MLLWLLWPAEESKVLCFYHLNSYMCGYQMLILHPLYLNHRSAVPW